MFLARGAGYGFFIFSILPLFFFTACIGGGGGGGGGGRGQVQYGGASSEFAAQSGLSQVAASAALADRQRARCVERVVIRAI